VDIQIEEKGNAVMSTVAEIDLAPLEDLIDRTAAQRQSGDGRVLPDDLIPLLQSIQEIYGYLPQPVLQHLSKRTGIPTSRMFGVITFYAQFYTEPHGKYTIRCCQGTACHVKGGKRIAEAIQQALGVEDGGTTEDMRFTFESVACLGTCFLAPVIMIDKDYYGQLTPDRITSILKKYD